MRYGLRALAVLLFFLATLTIFSGRTRGTGFLAARVAALEAELNRQPVVIDANGEEVGSVVSALSYVGTSVLFDIEGVPLFVMGVARDGFLPDFSTLVFESIDCTGQPLVLSPGRPHAPTVRFEATGEVWVGAGFQAGDERQVMTGSKRTNGSCGLEQQPRTVVDAILVPEVQAFTPPFEVVTRGDLLAE